MDTRGSLNIGNPWKQGQSLILLSSQRCRWCFNYWKMDKNTDIQKTFSKYLFEIATKCSLCYFNSCRRKCWNHWILDSNGEWYSPFWPEGSKNHLSLISKLVLIPELLQNYHYLHPSGDIWLSGSGGNCVKNMHWLVGDIRPDPSFCPRKA